MQLGSCPKPVMFKQCRFFTFSSQRFSAPSLKNLQKFWEHISVAEEAAGRRVCIDGKPMKTPNGNVLEIPYNKPRALAELVAQEWRVLPSLKLKSHMVPLTSLVGRSIDITDEERQKVANQLLPYLDTDTLCVISPKKDCEGQLRKAQEALYPVIMDDAAKVWGLREPIKMLDTETTLFGNYQSEETKSKVRNWIHELDSFKFASLERATTAAKSLVVGMNVALNRRPVSELAMLTSLDVIHQTALWGEVEDTHDVDREDLHRLLGAAYINAIDERDL